MPKILPKIPPKCQKPNFWHSPSCFWHFQNHFWQLKFLHLFPLFSLRIPFPKSCQKSCQKFSQNAKNSISKIYYVMAEALYPHGRLYLILSPSPFPSLSLTQIPRKSPRKEEENSPHLPTTPQNPHPLLSLSLSFASPSGAGFSFSEERQKTPEPQYFQWIGRRREGRRRKGLLG